jgi:tetratricopeptide (TPR) repeat protein
LIYREDIPEVIENLFKQCEAHLQRRNIPRAIVCVERAKMSAEDMNNNVNVGLASIWAADLYFESCQIGLALSRCEEAVKAFKLTPNYPHRHHAQAVLHYLRGLLYHRLGDDAKAQSHYQQALESFRKAIIYWEKLAEEGKRFKQLCERVSEWIKLLSRRLASDLPPTEGATQILLPVTDRDDYELAQLKMLAYVVAPKIVIKGREYELIEIDDGDLCDSNIPYFPPDAQYFLMCVEDEKWGGKYSQKGDYMLVKQEEKAKEGIGAVWDEDQNRWQSGEFVRKDGRIKFKPIPRKVIGGDLRRRKDPDGDEIEIEGKELGRALWLLQPVK